MGITEILRRIWLFSASKIKSSESFIKQPTQLIIVAHNFHNRVEQGNLLKGNVDWSGAARSGVKEPKQSLWQHLQ